MGSASSWYQIGKKACYIPKVSNVSVEKGQNVSSLACKRVFYRPENNAKGGTEFRKRGEMELNFEDFEIQNWNMPTEKFQRVD